MVERLGGAQMSVVYGTADSIKQTAGELTTTVLIRERARVAPDHKNFEDESLLRIAHPRLA